MHPSVMFRTAVLDRPVHSIRAEDYALFWEMAGRAGRQHPEPIIDYGRPGSLSLSGRTEQLPGWRFSAPIATDPGRAEESRAPVSCWHSLRDRAAVKTALNRRGSRATGRAGSRR
jgi:hypothetical protein